MPAEQENVATITNKTCQKLQDHLKHIFCNVRTNCNIHTNQKQQGLKLQTIWMRFDRLISCSIFKKSCKNDGVPQKSPNFVKTSNNSYIYYYKVNIGKSINIHNCTSNDNAVSNCKQSGWDLTVLSVVAFSKNHAKMMGCHKSLPILSKLPTIVIFTITKSILVKASIFTTAPATTMRSQTANNLDEIWPSYQL